MAKGIYAFLLNKCLNLQLIVLKKTNIDTLIS